MTTGVCGGGGGNMTRCGIGHRIQFPENLNFFSPKQKKQVSNPYGYKHMLEYEMVAEISAVQKMVG